ncbi:MAG: hypothetical protein RL133_1231 [Pseudomonadota bacterium]
MPDRLPTSAPIAQRIERLFELARRHGEAFAGPEASLARERYLAQHPTAVLVLKCMDGRINLSVATQTPAGILMPFRNLGGMFDLGWPHLGEVLHNQVMRMVHQGRRVLLLITYHFSRGEPLRGCAGFQYDRAASMRHTWQIRQQVQSIFGSDHQTVYPVVCGFETDEDALLIHGHSDDAVLDVSTLVDGNPDSLRQQISRLFPEMPLAMQNDLLPLLEGNVTHVAQTRELNARQARTLDIEHREWVICLGRGFDWLHTPNLALIIGPYSPDLAHPIRTAASIIESNMAAGRIPNDGFLLLASVPFEDAGADRARAEVKAQFLSSFAAQTIEQANPELAKKMSVCTAVLDWRVRRLERLSVHTAP